MDQVPVTNPGSSESAQKGSSHCKVDLDKYSYSFMDPRDRGKEWEVLTEEKY